MSKAKKKILLFAPTLTLLFALISSYLYIGAYGSVFNTELGYFERGFNIHTAAVILLLISSVLPLSLFFLFRKGELSSRSIDYSISSRLVDILCAMTLVAFVLLKLNKASAYGKQFMSIICIVFSVLSAVYFLLRFFNKNIKVTNLFGYFVILWLTFALFEAYRNYYVAMNSPIKTLLTCSALSLMLETLYELRFDVAMARPRVFIVSALVSTLIPFIFSVTFISCYFNGIIGIYDYLPIAIAFLPLAIRSYLVVIEYVSGSQKDTQS